MEDNTKSITQQLLDICGTEKRISCADARDFAEENNLDKAEVGKQCDDLDIKIFACDLGCF